MKKRRILFINRGKGKLFLERLTSDSTENESLEIRSRKVFKLSPGDHMFTLYFRDRFAVVESNLNGSLEVEDVPSPLSKRYTAKQIFLKVSDQDIRIICKEQVSIISIIEERGL